MPKRLIDLDAFLHEHCSCLTNYNPSIGLDESADCYPDCESCMANDNLCCLEVHAEDLNEFARRSGS